MVPASRAIATSPSNRVNPASALADRETGATIASQRLRMAERRVEPIRQLAFREGHARCPARAHPVVVEDYGRLDSQGPAAGQLDRGAVCKLRALVGRT